MIFVTGAGGRLGRLLRGAFLASGPAEREFLFSDRSGKTGLALAAEAVPDTLPHADMVVALWGATTGPDWSQNADLVPATGTVARATGAARVLHLSSAAVYGPVLDAAETDTPAPVNAYGRAKLEMERRVRAEPLDGVAQCCLRLCNVLGADSLAPALRAPKGAAAPLTQFADGRGPLRSYIPPGLLLRVLQGLAALDPDRLPDVLNVAAAEPVEMEALLRATGKRLTRIPPPEGDRQHVTLSTARLGALLPGLPLSMSAKEMIRDWQRAEAHT